MLNPAQKLDRLMRFQQRLRSHIASAAHYWADHLDQRSHSTQTVNGGHPECLKRHVSGEFRVLDYAEASEPDPASSAHTEEFAGVRSALDEWDDKAADKYLALAGDIEGWFSRMSATAIEYFHKAQSQLGIHGDMLEIGVHHGKSAMFFLAMRRPGELVHLNDLFDDQESNTSRSGQGNKDIFLANADRVVGDRLGMKLYLGPSRSLSAEAFGRDFRLIHIDGGHGILEAMNDILLAEELSVGKPTVTIVDDFFNIAWPEVAKAVLLYLEENRRPQVGSRLVPIFCEPKKLYMCNEASVSRYGSLMRNSLQAYFKHRFPGVRFKATTLGPFTYTSAYV